jgi:hypothetical protein
VAQEPQQIARALEDDADIESLKQMVLKLVERVNELEKKNEKVEQYAESLEARLNQDAAFQKEYAVGAPVVSSAATSCASTSCHTFLDDMGALQIGVAATGVIGHLESGEGKENDMASGSFNIYLEGPIASNAVFHLNVEGIGGNWDTGRTLLTSLNADSGSLQSDDGIDRLQIREAKVQAAFFDERLTAYIGKIDPTAYFDGNEGANDETAQFLAGALVNNETFTGTFPGGYVPGVGMYYDLSDVVPGVVIGTGLFSRDNSANHIFDNLVWVNEIDYALELAGQPGNYRVYGYVAGQESAASGVDDDENLGFGVSVDQKLTDSLLLFGRFGLNGNDLSAGDLHANPIMNTAFSLGMQLENPFLFAGWDRPGDALGLGYAQHKLFDDPTNTDEIGAEYERLIETYYRYQLNGQISFSPFYQYARNAGGDTKGDRLHIMGIRSSVEF